MITDLVCLHDEKAADGGDFTLVTESAKWRRKELKAGTYTVEELLRARRRKRQEPSAARTF